MSQSPHQTDHSSRRQFLKSTATVAASAGLLSASSVSLAKGSPNERLRVAVVGLGGRGRRAHVQSLLEMGNENVEIAALCDCDTERMGLAAKMCQEKGGKQPALVDDYKKILDDKNIDAVAIATPNHWHALQTIWACQAGKDVYVEKPGSYNIIEGRKMIQAARKYERIVQHGTQCRTSPKIREGIEKLKAGVIGRVYMARGIAFKYRAGGKHQYGPAPKTINWDRWLGPAPKSEYDKLAIRRWRFLKPFGNGEIGDQGVHQLDIIRWGLDLDTHPNIVQCMGGSDFRPTSEENTPGNQIFACKYKERDLILQFETRDGFTNVEAGMGDQFPFVDKRNAVGVIFIGTEGYMIIPDYSSYHVFLGRARKPGPSASVPGAPMMNLVQFQNWVGAIRSRKRSDLTAEIKEGHYSSTLAHLANIASETERTLHFDPKSETFLNDAEANKYLTREYRAPYSLPKEV